jgi:hypothetical protein
MSATTVTPAISAAQKILDREARRLLAEREAQRANGNGKDKA